MEAHLRGSGGALDQLGQLGLSELDLLKLAASGGFNADAYIRSQSAEVARAQEAQKRTFYPSWPPYAANSSGDAPPMMQNGLGAAGLGGGDATAELSYLAQLGVAAGGGAAAAGGSSAAFGEGPRIYVGGVPDLVTVAMVRDHFSRWGVVRHCLSSRVSSIRPCFCRMGLGLVRQHCP